MFSSESDFVNNSFNNYKTNMESQSYSSFFGNNIRFQYINFPYNRSLDEEIHRLFAVNQNNNNGYSSEIDTVMRDFRNNGRDTEYCPEFENGNYLSTASDSADDSFESASYAVSYPSSVPVGSSTATAVLTSEIFRQRRIRRDKRFKQPLPTECVFCKNNGANEYIYKGHCVKDQTGRVLCPVLRAYECPICKAQGDTAHTLKYCPNNKNTDLMKFDFSKYRNTVGCLRPEYVPKE